MGEMEPEEDKTEQTEIAKPEPETAELSETTKEETAMEVDDDEKKEVFVEPDTSPKLTLSDLTEQILFDALCEMQTSGTISIFEKGKKTFRTALEEKYGLDTKALKKCEAFPIAFDRFKTKMSEQVKEEEKEDENINNDENEKA